MMIKSLESPSQTPAKPTTMVLTDDVKAIRRTSWLSPIDQLDVVTSKVFGRQIKANIQQIMRSRRPMGLKLLNKFSVVVIDEKSYEELLSLKTKYAELVERVKQSDIAVASSQYDEMFARISAPKTASRFKSLRLASQAELAAAYKAGETESN